MEDQWLAWAKRLQAIASTGVHFASGPYDRERYVEIASIAHGMLAALGNVPVARIERLLSDFAQGYATPKVDVRGAVVEHGRILLVRERSDGLWALPGGYADVGLSPRENVVKEIREEAGIGVSVAGLYSVRHSAHRAYNPDIRDFYKLFFLCRRTEPGPLAPGDDIIEAGFFERASLPPLSRGRVVEDDIDAAFAFAEAPGPSRID